MLAGDHLVEQLLKGGQLGRVLGPDVGHRPIFGDEHRVVADAPQLAEHREDVRLRPADAVDVDLVEQLLGGVAVEVVLGELHLESGELHFVIDRQLLGQVPGDVLLQPAA